ncbi:MAG: ATP-binding cassette domain-containing protein [Planctomycetia bacterium]|nr:ATP-binding cassette domain-containing protein [Planctomycetia bacterium]
MNVISIQNATVRIDGKTILDDLSWSVKRGERSFILGANGAGKTTLVKIMTGFLWPLYGARVELLGHRLGEVNLLELRRKIAWVSPMIHQWLPHPKWTGGEIVISGIDSTMGVYRDISDEERTQARELLRLLRAEHLMEQRFVTMSSGEQVKILIARALITDPELMILDEPNVYLDVTGREFLLRTISELAAKRPDLTILFITQRIEDILPVFHRGMILKQGKIAAVGPREAVLTEENLKMAFEMEVRLIPTESGRLWLVPRH